MQRARERERDQKMSGKIMRECKGLRAAKKKGGHPPPVSDDSDGLMEIKPRPMSFFKIMIKEGSRCPYMNIPPGYVPHLCHLVDHNVQLKDCHGRVMEVRVARVADGSLAFEQGWREFASGHNIIWSDFVVFRPMGRTMFEVEIFDMSGCTRSNFAEIRENNWHDPKQQETASATAAFEEDDTKPEILDLVKLESAGSGDEYHFSGNSNSSYTLTVSSNERFLELSAPLPLSRVYDSKTRRRGTMVIFLRDSHMRLWPVLYADSGRSVRLLSGWGAFADANIEPGGETVCHLTRTFHEFSPEVFQVKVTKRKSK